MKVKEYIDVHLSGDITKYLSEKAEMKVEEALTEIMFGKPGLLLRGLISNRNTYNLLTKIVRDMNVKRNNNIIDKASHHLSWTCPVLDAAVIQELLGNDIGYRRIRGHGGIKNSKKKRIVIN